MNWSGAQSNLGVSTWRRGVAWSVYEGGGIGGTLTYLLFDEIELSVNAIIEFTESASSVDDALLRANNNVRAVFSGPDSQMSVKTNKR